MLESYRLNWLSWGVICLPEAQGMSVLAKRHECLAFPGSLDRQARTAVKLLLLTLSSLYLLWLSLDESKFLVGDIPYLTTPLIWKLYMYQFLHHHLLSSCVFNLEKTETHFQSVVNEEASA